MVILNSSFSLSSSLLSLPFWSLSCSISRSTSQGIRLLSAFLGVFLASSSACTSFFRVAFSSSLTAVSSALRAVTSSLRQSLSLLVATKVLLCVRMSSSLIAVSSLLSREFSSLKMSFSSLQMMLSSCFCTANDRFFSSRWSSIVLYLANNASQSADREMNRSSQLRLRLRLRRIYCQMMSRSSLLLLRTLASQTYSQFLTGDRQVWQYQLLLLRLLLAMSLFSSSTLKVDDPASQLSGFLVPSSLLGVMERGLEAQAYGLLSSRSLGRQSNLFLWEGFYSVRARADSLSSLEAARKKLTPQAKLSSRIPPSSIISTGSLALSKFPRPNYPQVLLPHVKTLRSRVETATPKNPRMKMRSTGEGRTIFLGFSSSPKLPEPQMQRLPSLSMAPLWYPAAMATMPSSSRMRVGWHSLTLCPMPSCPYLLLPMPKTCPRAVSRSVQKTPHSICLTLWLKLTSRGVAIFQGLFTPSSPYSFDPVVQMFPSASTNPLCIAPQEKCPTLPFSCTRVGTDFDLNSPVPNDPQSPRPQAYSSSFASCTHTCENPHRTFTALAGNFTLAGACPEYFTSAFPPTPSRPSMLTPQLQRLPSAVMKVTCFSEAERSVMSKGVARHWGRLKDLLEAGESRLCWLLPQKASLLSIYLTIKLQSHYNKSVQTCQGV